MVQTRSGLKLDSTSTGTPDLATKKQKESPPVTKEQPPPENVDVEPKSLDDVLKLLAPLFSNYDHFICPNEQTSRQFRRLARFLYGYGQQLQNQLGLSCSVKPGQEKPLRQLLVDGFDNEQIWQQLEVFNQQLIDWSAGEIGRIVSRRQPLTLNIIKTTDDDEKVKTGELSDDAKSILKSMEKKKAKKEGKKVQFCDETKNAPQKAKTISPEKVDFFDLKEMEQFLDDQDYQEMHPEIQKPVDEDDDIDYFADIPSGDEDDNDDQEEDAEEPMYADFFDPPKGSKTVDATKNDEMDEEDDGDDFEDDLDLDTRDMEDDAFGEMNQNSKFDPASDSEEDEDEFSLRDKTIADKLRALARSNANDDDDDDDPNKSEYEKSQTKLKKRIEKAEQDLLMPHNVRWQFAGETTGTIRPSNSLLEEYLQFDHVSRPPPVITDKTTASLEDMIKQRIKDRVFDDVERKVKPKEQPFEFRRRVVLESEKSKVGLAEVYEQEYLKQQQQKKLEQEMGSGQAAAFMAAGEVEESETRKAIRKQMRSLFRKLDSLSAFHFTPRPPEPEVRIINNLPAITVEEAVPDTISDAKLLAPEEVYSTRNQMVLQNKTERTVTDQKRARRLKKKKQKVKKVFLQSRLKLKPGTKAERKAKIREAADDRKSLSSSVKFFDRLQEKNEMTKNQRNKPKPKIVPDQNLAKKLKL